MDLIDMFETGQNLYGIWGNMVTGIESFSIAFNIGLVCMLLALYIFQGYTIMQIGRKAGLDNDWMAYIPVARQIYQMRIADCPWWYIFLYNEGTVNAVIKCCLVALSFQVGIVFMFLTIVYIIFTWIMTYRYGSSYYPKFGFHKNMAFIEIIWGMELFSQIFNMYIAFYNSVQLAGKEPIPESIPEYFPGRNGVKENTPGGGTIQFSCKISGAAGKYEGASFDISDGSEVVFGRSKEANIVFDQYETDISRRHCTVRFDRATGKFAVTDFSTNGTYLEDGSMLKNGKTELLDRGTVIYLGKNKKNAFRLG